MKKKHIKKLKAAFRSRFHREPTTGQTRTMKKKVKEIRTT